MRVLMIGMDGVHAGTFKRGWTPYINSLIERGESLNLEEDLISRGWMEIVTGQHGITTGALYEKPIGKGGYGWTENCKIGDVPELGQTVKPIWQILNEKGYRVGIMNVPTTFPAPKVSGFFVSGGGGGGPVNQEVSPDQCYPSDTKEYLDEIGYIVDERLISLLGEKKLYEPSNFFARLKEMNEKRAEAFIDLSKKKEVDFGFVVFKSSVVTVESLILPQLEKLDGIGIQTEKSGFISQARDFYLHFDNLVKKIHCEFNNSELLLVSDHSMTVKKIALNVNTLLQENGFQFRSASRSKIYNFLKSYKKFIPTRIRQQLKGNKKIKGAYESMLTFEPDSTKAFSQSLSSGRHGIYINDCERFSGPVKKEDIDRIIEEIVELFNTQPECISYGFTALRNPLSDALSATVYPDIILKLSDGVSTRAEFPQFIKKYPTVETISSLHFKEDITLYCLKASEPLAINTNRPWLKEVTFDNKNNLTVVYDHIINKFAERKERNK